MSGNAGHNATYHAACILRCGFNLSLEDAEPLLTEWNAKCQPPWSEADLRRKLEQAETAPGERGHLLNTERNGTPPATTNGKALRKPKALARVNSASDVPTLANEDGRTEIANAKRLVGVCGDDVYYIDQWGKWLVYDGRRFAIDHERKMELFAKQTHRELWTEALTVQPQVEAGEMSSIIRFIAASGSARGLRAMIDLARCERPLLPEQLDSDRMLLNVLNGTIDLRTCQLREHRREDFLTKIAPVNYHAGADCPLWLQFLRDITAGDRELQSFLRRAVGLSLTGDCREHVLFFCYGQGSNGKSTFLSTVQELLGEDYSMKAASDLLLAKKGSHPTELADLHGKRLVACIEAAEGRRLAESLVKELTGGDKVRARRMKEDFWQFDPSHKIWLAANHKPIIRGTDHGMWRRVKTIPFVVQIADVNQDKSLPAKLRGELSGILNWALMGCLEWQQTGLAEPEAVKAATAAYRVESDTLGQFLDECCLLGEVCEVGATDLHQAFERWGGTMPQSPFGKALTERGFTSDRYTTGDRKGRKYWKGLTLHT